MQQLLNKSENRITIELFLETGKTIIKSANFNK